MRGRAPALNSWRTVKVVDDPLTTENVDSYLEVGGKEYAFQEVSKQLISKYNIHRTRTATTLDAQRIGYLFSLLSMKLYKTAHFATDAEHDFYNWARTTHVHCDCIRSREYVTSGKKEYEVPNPYVDYHEKFFDKISFSRFIYILERVAFQVRKPIRTRTPIVRIL